MSDSHDQNIAKAFKILIVEDDAADSALIQKRIGDIWPHSNITATSSLGEAYEVYKNTVLDLVLLDLNLPDGYGPASVREMRSFNKSVPIVVLTSAGSDLAINEAMKLGANHVLVKSQIFEDAFAHVLGNFFRA